MTSPRTLRRIAGPLIVAAAAAGALPARACGPDTDCAVGNRSYRIALAERDDGGAPIGAIVFVHGYRGTAAGVMHDEALRGLAADLGIALIAAQAAGPEWTIPGVPSVDARAGVDELAYFDALAEDVTRRFHVDRAQIVVAGFSSGAMMVWHLACQRGNAFAGYVPMSGTFWAPLPASCPGGAVNLIHYHGTDNPVVPLEGRPIKDGHQGDVSAAMALMAQSGDYGPAEAAPEPGLDCTRRQSAEGRLLEPCLFNGKHEMKTQNLRRAWLEFARAAEEAR